MFWLAIIILAYFLFAVVSLVDRYLLIGPPSSKIYTFYVGILGILSLALAPFVGFFVPDFYKLIFCLTVGAVYILALFALYFGLERFEASRIVPAVGGFLPILTFLLVYFLSGFRGTLSFKEFLAFILLILGSIIINYSSSGKISFESLKISAIIGLLLSLSFVLTKYVYLQLPFWTGFIWIRIGSFLTALFFILFKTVRKEIFSGTPVFNLKTRIFFLLNQGVGAGAFILQNWAISLAGLIYLPLINALQGIQYFFLFILGLLFLKEGLSKKVIGQKIAAILIIGIGLAILAVG